MHDTHHSPINFAMNTTFAVWTMALALAAPASNPRVKPLDPARPMISDCQVSLIEEVQIPAQEAGVLKSINVREGMQVAQDSLLAQIDDRPSMIARDAAIAERAAAA